MPLHLALLASLDLVFLASHASAAPPRAQVVSSVAMDEDGDEGEEEEGLPLRIAFKITQGGKTHEHADLNMHTGEELGFTFVQPTHKKGKKKHAIVLYVEQTPDGGGFTAELKYSLNGKQLIVGTGPVTPRTWKTFKSKDGKTTVAFQVDDQPKKAEKVELPKGEGPLDGVDKDEDEAPKKPKRKKLDLPDGNNPLDGI